MGIRKINRVAALAAVEFRRIPKLFARGGREVKPPLQVSCADFAFGIPLVARSHTEQTAFYFRAVRECKEHIRWNGSLFTRARISCLRVGQISE